MKCFILLRSNLQRYFQFSVFKSSAVLWTNFRPAYPTEELEEEEITEDDAELMFNKLEESAVVGLPNGFDYISIGQLWGNFSHGSFYLALFKMSFVLAVALFPASLSCIVSFSVVIFVSFRIRLLAFWDRAYVHL